MLKNTFFFLCSIIASSLFAQEQLYYLLAPDSTVITTIEYDEISEFVEGLALTRLNGKYGYIDTKGKVAIPLTFDEARTFSSNKLAAVKQGWKWGFIDNTGKFVIPVTYENVYDFDANNLAIVQKEGNWGAINLQQKEIIPFQYNEIHTYKGIIYVIKEGAGALYSTAGVQISEFKYDNVEACIDGMLLVSQNGLWGVIDTKGKEIFPCKYNEIGRLSEDIVGVMLNGKAGYLNLKNKTVIACVYESIDEFREGLAAVKKENKWGYVDKTGKVVIPFVYDEAYKFYDGAATVSKDGKSFEITPTNQIITSVVHTSLFDKETPQYKAVEVEKGKEIELIYPNLGLKVKKIWQGYGNASNGIVHDLQSNELLAENVLFEKNKIVSATLYHKGKSYFLTQKTLLLAELRKQIEVESSKPKTQEEIVAHNELIIKKYKELQALFNELDKEYLNTFDTDYNLDDTPEMALDKRKKQVALYLEKEKKLEQLWDFILKNDERMNESNPNYQPLQKGVLKHSNRAKTILAEIDAKE